jgi:phage anti-repressor protein
MDIDNREKEELEEKEEEDENDQEEDEEDEEDDEDEEDEEDEDDDEDDDDETDQEEDEDEDDAISDIESDDEILDTTWVNEYKKSESIYNDFYKEPVTSIGIYLLYINKDNELEHTHRDRCLLEKNGLLKRDIIMSFIKRYQYLFSVNYKLKSLLQYNIDLEPVEVSDFVNEEKSNLFENRFIKTEKYLNDIHFEDSIHMFQDLNALFFIFMEEKPIVNHTRRISMVDNNKKTRRINHKEILKKNLKIFKEIQ